MALFLREKVVIVLLFICGLVELHQCCTNDPLNCTSVASTLKCDEVASCLKVHWFEMPPYAYLADEDPITPYGIMIGNFSNCCLTKYVGVAL